MKNRISCFKNAVPFVFLILFSLNGHAQYTVEKEIYNHRDYIYNVNDRYHPAFAGVASCFIPGLGQIYCNENKRGLRFLLGYGGGILIMMSGAIISTSSELDDGNPSALGTRLIVGGFMLTSGVQIWSTVDAVRVAKVKNMALRSNNGVGMSISLSPSVILTQKRTPGLTLAVQF